MAHKAATVTTLRPGGPVPRPAAIGIVSAPPGQYMARVDGHLVSLWKTAAAWWVVRPDDRPKVGPFADLEEALEVASCHFVWNDEEEL